MKKMNILVTLFATFAPLTTHAEEKVLTLSPEQSSISWIGKKVTGQHDGVLKVRSGTIKIVDGKVRNGEFDIDMNSIAVKDIKDEKNNKKLLDHLHSDDFFSATSHPVAKFIISDATPLPSAKSGEPNYTVTGKLDIKGITNDVTFPALINVSENEGSAKATVTLDRTKWNIKYGSGKFFEGLGDKLIYDDFVVAFDVKAKA